MSQGNKKNTTKALDGKQSKFLATITKNIAWIAATGEQFDAKVQATTKMVLRYMSLYHDKRPAIDLLNAVAKCKGYVVNELVQYLKKHSPLEVTYEADKRTIADVTEKRDDKGNLLKAYSPDDVLDSAPFHAEAAVTNRTKTEIQPWSFSMYKDRLGSIKDQINKAGKADGRGILGSRNGVPVALHEGDKEYIETYNRLITAVNAHQADFDNIVKLVSGGTPAAAIPPTAEAPKVTTPTATVLKPKATGRTSRKIAA